MPERKRIDFEANDVQSLIDDTYNPNDQRIIEKTQNAYLMPLSMLRDVDCIDTFRFYEEDDSPSLSVNHKDISEHSKKNEAR